MQSVRKLAAVILRSWHSAGVAIFSAGMENVHIIVIITVITISIITVIILLLLLIFYWRCSVQNKFAQLRRAICCDVLKQIAPVDLLRL